MRISDWSSDVCSSDLVGAEHVALVDHGPELVAARIISEADRIAQARGEGADIAVLGPHLEYRGAAEFVVHALFADIAVGADADIEPAVRGRDEALGPMAVGALCRQVGDLLWLSRPSPLAPAIRKMQPDR